MPDIQPPIPEGNDSNTKSDLNFPPVGPLVTTGQPPPPKAPELKLKYPPLLWDKTQELIKQIETKISGRLLVYYMHSSTQINNEDVDYFYSHVRELKPEDNLYLVLVSSGGSGMAAWRIANVLRKYCNQLNVIIPSRCASAATLLSLSADKIFFGPAGFLTAIDTSLSHPLNPQAEGKPSVSISVDQINKVKKFISEDLRIHPNGKTMSEILFDKIHPVVFGELARSSSLSKMIAKNMISLRNDKPTEEAQSNIVDILNDTYPAHGYPIVLKEAKKIGLPAEEMPEDLNVLIWDLIKLYSMVTKKAVTNITPDLYHLEGSPVLIESGERRTFFVHSYDSRFLASRGRVIENDNTGWLTARPNPESPQRPIVSEIEL
jgi:ATP-dependent protease ClpP protease subunit